MNRRALLVGLAATLAVVGLPATAQTATKQVVDQMRQQGFRKIEVRRTLLGRVRVVGEGPLGKREVVLNPSTGAILRDYTDRSEAHGNSGSGSSNSGSGIGDDDDDEDDDDDRDDDDSGDDDSGGDDSGGDDDDSGDDDSGGDDDD